MSYKIKWQGYPNGEQWTSWVLESDLMHAWDLLENFKHRDRLAQVGSVATASTALDQARSGQVWPPPYLIIVILFCVLYNKGLRFNTCSNLFTVDIDLGKYSCFVQSKPTAYFCVPRRVEDREFFDKVSKGELTWENGEDLYTRVKSRRSKMQVSCILSPLIFDSQCE